MKQFSLREWRGCFRIPLSIFIVAFFILPFPLAAEFSSCIRKFISSADLHPHSTLNIYLQALDSELGLSVESVAADLREELLRFFLADNLTITNAISSSTTHIFSVAFSLHSQLQLEPRLSIYTRDRVLISECSINRVYPLNKDYLNSIDMVDFDNYLFYRRVFLQVGRELEDDSFDWSGEYSVDATLLPIDLVQYGLSILQNFNIVFTDNSSNILSIARDGLKLYKDGRHIFFSLPFSDNNILTNSAINEKYGSWRGGGLGEGYEVREVIFAEEVDVVKQIERFFNYTYPSFFNPLRLEDLRKILRKDGKPAILSGHLDSFDILNGVERVKYRWYTVNGWLKQLKNLQLLGREFHVDTELLRVYEDPLFPDRYWAVVFQKWRTVGGGYTLYRDEGFLLINFDIKDNSINNLEIQYRLWVYNYHLFDRELRLSRYDKIARDYNSIFKSSEELSIGGIPETLQNEILSFIKSLMQRELN